MDSPPSPSANEPANDSADDLGRPARVRGPLDPAEAPDARPQEGVPAAADSARVEALITLLGDESLRVAEVARDELIRLGEAALPALRRAEKSGEAAVRGRARTLTNVMDRKATRRRLVRYLAQKRIELEPAFFLMARLHDPHLDAQPYKKALDAFADRVRKKMEREPTVHPGLVLAQVLGGEIGFEGSQEDYHHPDRIHVHRVIETRAGLPLSLCAVYLFVASRVGIRAGALPVPGHVVLRVHGGDRPILIDPFRGGEMRTHKELLDHLTRHGLAPQPTWFHDAADALLVQRQLVNLMQSCRLRGFPREAREAHRLAAMVERGRRRPRA